MQIVWRVFVHSVRRGSVVCCTVDSVVMQEALAVAAGRQLEVSGLVGVEAAGTQLPLV